ncbi:MULTISPECIES: 3'-5' exonuclease [unclassified Spirosoma]|uniref:3'-5' exonuclease n=1 Tax=unclassified Spirosoma TaxID=2621999 RepID=UPI00095DCC43|nr:MULTISPECIES: 3'-5' exonuclease [unclassified Spirosoma]MBN8825088.1 3'-5' exonuclease [Spirosoma sp.]OJW77218.1 MAG: hypothetical protein BGO59_31695 [Spirosoma sp. 48-14]
MIYYLDTETTGLSGSDEVIELALVDDQGEIIIDTLLRPTRNTEWEEAECIHGITPEMVLCDDLPTLADLAPQLTSILAGHTLVIYNVAFDSGFLKNEGVDLSQTTLKCCQNAYAVHYGEWSDYFCSYKFKKLTVAADEAEFRYDGSNPHRALWDTLACRAVWQYLTIPGRMEEVEKIRKKRWRDEWDDREVRWFWEEQEKAEKQQLKEVNEAWEKIHFPAMNIRRKEHFGDQAKKAAAIFCLIATGYQLAEWNTWYKWCRLPKFHKGQYPETWKTRTDRGWYMLRAWVPIYKEPKEQYKYPQPVGMLIKPHGDLEPLYDPDQLTLSVDWVPIADGWPEVFVSITRLQKDYKVKKKDLTNIRPAYLKRSKYGDYLLYPIPEGAVPPKQPVRVKPEPKPKPERISEDDFPF